MKRFSAAVDVAHCRRLLRAGSRTFFAASLILPAGMRAPSAGLYAFCRVADDAIDLGTGDRIALSAIRRRLERIYRGQPDDHAVDRVFADAVLQRAIPAALPQALLEGFAWDLERRQYQSLAELERYAIRVAGTVGLMMALVMGVRDRATLAHACDLGVAMQLTNIARDVGEDARNGRLYLPLDWMREEGIEPQRFLQRPDLASGLARVVERLLLEAEARYVSAETGIAALPAGCRPGMRAARLLYAEIGHEVARRRFDSVHQRAVVSWQRKARILADSLVAGARKAPAPARAVPADAAHLIDCAIASGTARPSVSFESARERIRWPRIEDRITWLIDLFERLERRERPASDVLPS